MKRILVVLMLAAFAAPVFGTVEIPNEAPVLYDPGDGPRNDDPGDGPIICPGFWSALFDASLIVFDGPAWYSSFLRGPDSGWARLEALSEYRQ